MNPTWQPPQDAEQFIHEVKEKARHHEDTPDEVDRHSEALESVSAGVSINNETINDNLAYGNMYKIVFFLVEYDFISSSAFLSFYLKNELYSRISSRRTC